MKQDQRQDGSVSRRDFLRATGVGMAGLGLGAGGSSGMLASVSAVGPAGGGAGSAGLLNILFLLTDQERLFRPGELPADYHLPGHDRLTRRGTTFLNHRINSCVCTPSRSVIYTGQDIQHTKMFDNTNFPWISSMSTDMHTLGDMLRDAGYYTVNGLIEQEVGEDVGRMLPGGVDGGWVATPAVNDL